MIFVLPIHHKTLLLLLLAFFFWLALIHESSHAALTAEALYTDLSMAREAINNDKPEHAENILHNVIKVEK